MIIEVCEAVTGERGGVSSGELVGVGDFKLGQPSLICFRSCDKLKKALHILQKSSGSFEIYSRSVISDFAILIISCSTMGHLGTEQNHLTSKGPSEKGS